MEKEIKKVVKKLIELKIEHRNRIGARIDDFARDMENHNLSSEEIDRVLFQEKYTDEELVEQFFCVLIQDIIDSLDDDMPRDAIVVFINECIDEKIGRTFSFREQLLAERKKLIDIVMSLRLRDIYEQINYVLQCGTNTDETSVLDQVVGFLSKPIFLKNGHVIDVYDTRVSYTDFCRFLMRVQAPKRAEKILIWLNSLTMRPYNIRTKNEQLLAETFTAELWRCDTGMYRIDGENHYKGVASNDATHMWYNYFLACTHEEIWY